jgi:hypothetical protein
MLTMTRSCLRLIVIVGLVAIAALTGTPDIRAQSPQAVAGQRPGFPATLSGARVKFGSPTLANISGDSRPEIIVGGIDGIVYALNGSGAVLWTFNVSNAINTAAQSIPGLVHSTKVIPIRSAPAVADLTGDGVPEIVISAGEVFEAHTNGGVVVLNASGQLLPGWPQLPIDSGGSGGNNGSPDGYADGIVSSPAIGDIDGDGSPDIVYGAFDQRVYARHVDGSLLTGWPQFVLDTIWSSPALADINGDGQLDVVIGVDAHNYNGPPRTSQDGGDLYVFSGNGSIQWRAHQDEIIQSSPAIADLDEDGLPEIVVGTGTYYSNPPFNRSVGRYINAWNNDGSLRWHTALPERAPGSPAIADINGDGHLDVVIGALDGKVYALDGRNGAILWSTLARDIFNNQYIPNPQVYSPVLGDVDGDGLDDVLIGLGWDVVVMKGTNGALLTGTSAGDARPSYYGAYTIDNTPAVGDLDNNGKLDLVSVSGTTADPGNARVNSWALTSSTLKASWPMFRGSAQHTGTTPALVASATHMGSLLQVGQSRTYQLSFHNSNGSPLNWSATQTDPQNILQLAPTSGGSSTNLLVTITAPGSPGTYAASIQVTSAGLEPVTIDVDLIAATSVEDVFMPLMER